MGKVGENLAALFPKNGTILTQCFGETIIGMMLRAARKNNNDIKIFCAETRPYLQGARLTSTCCAQMGFYTTVFTDIMVDYSMQHKGIDLFTSAADTIARDVSDDGSSSISTIDDDTNTSGDSTGSEGDSTEGDADTTGDTTEE